MGPNLPVPTSLMRDSCWHPCQTSRVHGHIEPEWCQVNRSRIPGAPCGPDASLFEQKPVEVKPAKVAPPSRWARFVAWWTEVP